MAWPTPRPSLQLRNFKATSCHADHYSPGIYFSGWGALIPKVAPEGPHLELLHSHLHRTTAQSHIHKATFRANNTIKRRRFAHPLRSPTIAAGIASTVAGAAGGDTGASGGGDSSRAPTAGSGWGLQTHGTASPSASPSFRPPRPSVWRQWVIQIRQWLLYRLMLLLQLPTWGKLLALVGVGLPIVLGGSWLLVRASGGDVAWGEAAQATFYVLQNVPGADITRFSEAGARLVLVVVHLVSLFIFATLVGLMTEDVRSILEEIRCGNFPLPARDHTVVLDGSGDADRVAGVLQKVLGTRAALGGDVYGGDIAILTAHPKDELEKLIADRMPEHAGRVVTRYGNPAQVSDLERVAVAHARTVLLLAPRRPTGRHVVAGLQQQLCLTALRSIHARNVNLNGDKGWEQGQNRNQDRGEAQKPTQKQQRGRRRQRVVVESGSAAVTTVTARCGGGLADSADPLEVTYMSSTSSAYRVAVQCAVQPGLAAVFDAVFCRPSDASIRVLDLPAGMADHTFAEVRRRFRRAVLCGLLPGAADAVSGSSDGGNGNCNGGDGGDGVGGGGSVVLSPPDDWRLRPNDRLVLLAAAAADCHPLPGEPPPEAPLPYLAMAYDTRRSLPTSLVLLVYDSRLEGTLVAALQEFLAPEGCTVTVVSPEPCTGLPSCGPTPRSSGLTFRNVVGDPLSPAALAAADVAAADAVILMGMDDCLSTEEVDTVAVGTALLLQHLVADPRFTAPSGTSEDFWGNISSLSSADVSKLQPPPPPMSMTRSPLSQLDEPSGRRRRDMQPSRPLTFVCSLHDAKNRSVLQYIAVEACRTAISTAATAGGGSKGGAAAATRRGLSIEVIEPEALTSGMLAQVGAEPLLANVLEDLLDEQGCEIYIKKCDLYGIAPGSLVSWSQVTEIVRKRGDVALGLIRPGGRLLLAPPADLAVQQLGMLDELVVLSESFSPVQLHG